jgi:hypothetical protein
VIFFSTPTCRRVVASQKKKKKRDLRRSYGTVLVVFFKAVGVEALFFINMGYAGFGAQTISRSKSLGLKD